MARRRAARAADASAAEASQPPAKRARGGAREAGGGRGAATAAAAERFVAALALSLAPGAGGPSGASVADVEAALDDALSALPAKAAALRDAVLARKGEHVAALAEAAGAQDGTDSDADADADAGLLDDASYVAAVRDAIDSGADAGALESLCAARVPPPAHLASLLFISRGALARSRDGAAAFAPPTEAAAAATRWVGAWAPQLALNRVSALCAPAVDAVEAAVDTAIGRGSLGEAKGAADCRRAGALAAALASALAARHRMPRGREPPLASTLRAPPAEALEDHAEDSDAEDDGSDDSDGDSDGDGGDGEGMDDFVPLRSVLWARCACARVRAACAVDGPSGAARAAADSVASMPAAAVAAAAGALLANGASARAQPWGAALADAVVRRPALAESSWDGTACDARDAPAARALLYLRQAQLRRAAGLPPPDAIASRAPRHLREWLTGRGANGSDGPPECMDGAPRECVSGDGTAACAWLHAGPATTAGVALEAAAEEWSDEAGAEECDVEDAIADALRADEPVVLTAEGFVAADVDTAGDAGADADGGSADEGSDEDESGSDDEVEDALDDDLFFEDEDGGDGDVDAGHVGAEGAAEGAEALMGAAELDDDYDAEASGSEGEEA